MKKNRNLYGEILLRIFSGKALRVMKLTLILLMFTVIQLLAEESYSQFTKLTLKLEDVKISKALKEIENQSEFLFIYSPKLIDVERLVNLDSENEPIKDILNSIFDDKVKFAVNDRQVILAPAEQSGILSEFQQKKITGSVADKSGVPLPGVSIVIKGTTSGTLTDLNGNFSLEIPPDAKTLTLSFVGMITQDITIGNQTVFNITLEESAIGLDEVVVVGYGIQKKMNLTGSVASISSKELENKPMPNVGEVLRGVSPNLNIKLSGYGGEPGSSLDWNIRGMGSISGNDSPLILVDGVEMDINNLDPGNIESVSVLKDASASAIYGSRAPFGVVLITTKRGKKGEAVHVQYNNNTLFGTTLGIAHMENSVIFATVYNQAAANAGSPPVFPDEQVQRMKDWLAGTYHSEYDPNNPPNSIWSGRRVGNASYDWPHEYMKKLKIDQKHNINISGGSDKTQYYISLGYYDEGGFYSVGYDDYKRYDVLANFSSEVTNWLRFDFSTKYAKSQTDYPLGITTVERRYFFENLYLFGPNTPKYNINGSSANAMLRSIEDSGRDKTNINDLLVTVKTEIEPVKGWKTSASINYNVAELNNTVNPKPIMVELGTGGFGNVGKPSAAYETSFFHSPYTLFNLMTSYEKILGNHYVKALVGYEQEEKFYTYLYARGDKLITEEVPSLSTALGVKTVDDTKYDWATQGVFGRLNYNFRERYLFEFSARYNGSSRFAPDSRWGFFPSAYPGYQISQEDFWAGIKPYVNRLKIRGSYGSFRNQNITSYLYIPSVPIINETPWIIGGERPAYAQTPDLISEGLTWEKITTLNFGVDAGFLNNRLDLTFDWFNRRNSDMFQSPGDSSIYPGYQYTNGKQC